MGNELSKQLNSMVARGGIEPPTRGLSVPGVTPRPFVFNHLAHPAPRKVDSK